MITCNAVIKTLGVLVFVSVTALPASGEVPSACTNWPAKPPWEWTIEERLAHRFQRDCLVARRREAGDTSRPDGSCLAKGNVADFVFGTDTPQLFLPFELFDSVIMDGWIRGDAQTSHWRGILERKAADAGVVLPTNFWEIIGTNAKEYIAKGSASPQANCAARVAALARVRKAMPPGFDRFLYTVVAPGICCSGDQTPEQLRWIANGCP